MSPKGDRRAGNRGRKKKKKIPAIPRMRWFRVRFARAVPCPLLFFFFGVRFARAGVSFLTKKRQKYDKLWEFPLFSLFLSHHLVSCPWQISGNPVFRCGTKKVLCPVKIRWFLEANGPIFDRRSRNCPNERDFHAFENQKRV